MVTLFDWAKTVKLQDKAIDEVTVQKTIHFHLFLSFNFFINSMG